MSSTERRLLDKDKEIRKLKSTLGHYFNCSIDNAIKNYKLKQEIKRYRAALELIKNLSGAGMSYQDMVIECREIAKLAFDPDYNAILMGRYDEDSHKLFDILRTKGGKDE